MKRIAVITGASSGMGRRFAETVDTFGRFDEIWVIARHEAVKLPHKASTMQRQALLPPICLYEVP